MLMMRILRYTFLISFLALISSGLVSADAAHSAVNKSRQSSIEKSFQSEESGDHESEYKDYLAPDEIKALGKVHPRKHLKRSRISKAKPKAEPERKLIALTFDDGPHQNYTPQLLRILKERNVKATFFVVGVMAERYPYLIRAEFRSGHTIGNHTYHHPKLSEMAPMEISHEINTCGDAIERITGIKPRYFRPSGGNYNGEVVSIVKSLGYKMVLWTLNSEDIANLGVTRIVSRIEQRSSNGGIILLHDGVEQTIAALPSIIDVLRSRGYEFVTIDELLGK